MSRVEIWLIDDHHAGPSRHDACRPADDLHNPVSGRSDASRVVEFLGVSLPRVAAAVDGDLCGRAQDA